jgi:hypothetical protein
LGVRAVEGLIDGHSDEMVGLDGRGISLVPLEKVTSMARKVNMDHVEIFKKIYK